MNESAAIVAIGTGATLLLDAWGLARRPLLGQPRPDYAPIGRWIGHIARGRVRHRAIAGAAPIPGERALGWATHYLVGIAFAALLVRGAGADWLAAPSAPPALLFGLATVAVPWLIVQPALGAGLAGSRTRDPRAARLQSLASHFVFGCGLWLSACGLRMLPGA